MTPSQFTYHVWLASRTLPHGDRPTRKHVRVARALARHPSAMPSHRQLARAAECCIRTVQNALARLRGLGMLKWLHVFDRRMRPSDQRTQRPNIYLFPDAPFLRFCPDSLGRQTSGKSQMPPPSQGWLALEQLLNDHGGDLVGR